MYPTVQLIQLILRIEGEAAAQHRPNGVDSADFVVEKTVHLQPHRPDNRVKPVFKLPGQQQRCECA